MRSQGGVEPDCGARSSRCAVRHGFAWDVEAIAMARALGVPVQEIGIEWSHQRRLEGQPNPRRRLRCSRHTRIRRNVTSTLRTRSRSRHRGGRAVHRRQRLGPRGSRCRSLVVSCQGDVRLIVHPTARPGHWLARRHRRRIGGVSALLGWDPERTLVLEATSDACPPASEDAARPVARRGRRFEHSA